MERPGHEDNEHASFLGALVYLLRFAMANF